MIHLLEQGPWPPIQIDRPSLSRYRQAIVRTPIESYRTIPGLNSPDLRGHVHGLGLVALGIDLGDVGAGVPEGDLGRFETKPSPYLSRVGVPELVWVPVRDGGFSALDPSPVGPLDRVPDPLRVGRGRESSPRPTLWVR
jgi:hypothetical protein